MSDGWRESASLRVEGRISWKVRNQSGPPFAYVIGVEGLWSLRDGLRGRFWFSYFRSQQSLRGFAIAPGLGSIGRRADLLDHLCATGHDEL